MSNLSAFIKPAYREKTIEFEIGDRFLDEEGNPVKIKMKSLTQEQLTAIARQSMRGRGNGDKKMSEIDAVEHLNRCLIASIVYPDLTSKELCDAYGVVDPITLPTKMFLVDEYEKLAAAFGKLNGLGDRGGKLRIPGEVTKN